LQTISGAQFPGTSLKFVVLLAGVQTSHEFPEGC
jgi:hypothetical protein